MPVTAPRTTKPATSPARRSTRASSAAAAAKDPRFNRVIEKLEKSSAKVKEHVPPARKAAEAQAAAQPPANEKLAGAKANQVDTMKGAETKKPDPDSFLTLLRAEIEKIMPKTLGDTENFMEGDQKGQLKGAMTGNVNQQKEEASGDIKAASSQEPDPSTVEGKEVTPLPADEATSAPPAIGAAEAVPTAKPENEVSLQKSKQDADQQLKDAEVTPGQLQEANDPRFSAVLTAKSALGKQADSAPQQYRSSEQKTLTQEAAKAVGDEKQGIIAFQHEKGKSGVAVKLKQLSAKQKDEARRKEVTDTIEKIYNETKQTVETKLASLETDVSSLFDAGIEAAMTKMKNSIDKRMDAYKDERYDVIGGSLLWAHDKLFGMPDEVNVFYEDGRKLFMKELDTLVVNIAKVVETRLKEAKDEIAKGQKRINDYVQSLPKDLQAVGKAAEKDVAYRFEDLSRSIDDKKNALAQKLAQRYKEATNKANEQLKKMQEENKGLVTKFIEKLGEIIKILREFKERISAMLKKGWETIKLIVAHPIRFLGNLITAIKMGVQQFSTNILKQLEEGLMNWLFGSLAEAGIEIPPDLSLGSILKLVLQVLGLTYDRIRAKAVKLIGAGNVMLLEKAWQFISTLIKGGPAALWEQIKEFLGNLKEMITKAIQDWIVEGVIRAAIKKLVLMFNPVGAIIGAIMAIYDTVMFFIERINQILAFVEAIINSVYKIATGDVSTAAKWIEDALAKAIPIIISFFARFLGLTGIAEKIKETIKKIQDTVDKALDKLIEKAVAGVGKLVGKGKDSKPDERTPQQKEADLDAAIKEVQQLINHPGLPTKTIVKALPKIQSKYRLESLKLTDDGSGKYHVVGSINPTRGTSQQRLLTDEETAGLEEVAKKFAVQIKQRGLVADFKKDPVAVVSGLTSGEIVEKVGRPTVERYAREKGYTIWYNVTLELYDKKGAKLGGQQAELDGLLISGGGVMEILSAKLDYGAIKKEGKSKVGPSITLYYQHNLRTITPQKARAFGTMDYGAVRGIRVAIGHGGPKTIELSDFQDRYPLSPTWSVVGLTPVPDSGPAEPGRLTIGLLKGLTKQELLQITADTIKQYL